MLQTHSCCEQLIALFNGLRPCRVLQSVQADDGLALILVSRAGVLCLCAASLCDGCSPNLQLQVVTMGAILGNSQLSPGCPKSPLTLSA